MLICKQDNWEDVLDEEEEAEKKKKEKEAEEERSELCDYISLIIILKWNCLLSFLLQINDDFISSYNTLLFPEKKERDEKVAKRAAEKAKQEEIQRLMSAKPLSKEEQEK